MLNRYPDKNRMYLKNSYFFKTILKYCHLSIFPSKMYIAPYRCKHAISDCKWRGGGCFYSCSEILNFKFFVRFSSCHMPLICKDYTLPEWKSLIRILTYEFSSDREYLIFRIVFFSGHSSMEIFFLKILQLFYLDTFLCII